MKKVLFILLFLQTVFFTSMGQARYWVGPLGGNWSLAANWSLTSGGGGGAGAPTSVQDAIINTSTAITIDVGVGVNSITITNNSSVIFQSAVSRNIAPTSTSLASPAFRLDAGSVLTIDCTNAGGTNNFILDLSNGIGVVGQIDGTLIFSGSGGSAGAAAKFNTFSGALSYGNVTVSSTGYIKFLDNTGNATTSAGSFTMQNGATYEIAKNGGSFPNGVWQVTSLALANGTGAIGPTFLGLTYGNLQVNCPTITTPIYFNANISFNDINLISTGSDVVRAKTGTGGITFTLTINGDLTVSSFSVLETSGNTTTSGNPGIIIVKGNVVNNGTIRENGAAVGNQFILQGTLNQNISGTGTYTGDDFDFIINNSSGATLLSAVTLPYRYIITSGNILLGNNNLTTPAINQVGGATSSTNHVVTNGTGKLVINNIGATIIIFPIGASASSINPLEIFNGGGLNYGARVEIGINPPIAVPVSAVNRTWVVNPSGTPAGAVNVNFFYNNTDGNASFNFAPSTVEQGFYTTVWNIVNTGLTQSGGPLNFQVNGNANIFAANTDAPMVIANIGAILAVNNTVQLSAQKQNEKTLLNWTASIVSNIDRFAAERSADGQTYSAMAALAPNHVSYTDQQPLPGLNYYRIKAIEKGGRISFSNIAVVLYAPNGFEVMNIAPNPVIGGTFILNICAAQKTQIKIMITDIHGRLIQKQMVNMIAGFNSIPVNVATLARGTYKVYGNTVDGRSQVLRFVVQ